jgi:uncharacterized protein (DUF1697 family)
MQATVYLALLRGINVGGKAKLEMPRLKALFESLGLNDVRTYINSGNVIFRTHDSDRRTLQQRIESAIEAEFGLQVPVVLRSREEMKALVEALPDHWVNDAATKCDVMFLWPEIDRPEILEQMPYRPEIEDVVYFPGAVVWRVDRDKVNQGRVLRVAGTGLVKLMTIRNPNTVRKLYELMRSA